MALNSKAHSSNTPCHTPMVSTYSGPCSSHTVDTERQLSVRVQLKSQTLSVPFVLLPSPGASLGGYRYSIGGIYESKRPFSCGLYQRNRRKIILTCVKSNQVKRELWIQMDLSKSAQVCPKAQKALQRLQEKKREVYPA